MATTTFNPEELIFHKVRQVNAYDISDGKLLYMMSHVKDPSLETSADKEDITDEDDNIISSIYKAKTATFSGTNALIHLGLWAAQSGDEKHVLNRTLPYTLKNLSIPTFEIVNPYKIEDNKVTISLATGVNSTYGSLAGSGTETIPKYIYRISGSAIRDVIPLLAEAPTDTKTIGFTNEVGNTTFYVYNLSDVSESDEFYVGYDVASRTDTSHAVYFDNIADKFPKQCSLKIFAYFLDPCDNNTVYSGVIVADRAQLNPESFTLDLTSTSGHPFEYTIQKPYCDNSENSRLYRVIITNKLNGNSDLSTSSTTVTTG